MRKTPADIYKSIKAAAPADLDVQVYDVLKLHVGKENSISRRRLVEIVFGINLPKGCDLSISTCDRQVREAIARLQNTVPILSSSGEGGYYLPASREDVTRFAAEIVSRARKLEAKARRLEQLASKEFGQQMSLL